MKSVTENVILTGLERNEVPLVTATEATAGASTMKFTMSVADEFVSSVLAASPSARTSCRECEPVERAVNRNDKFETHWTSAVGFPFNRT